MAKKLEGKSDTLVKHIESGDYSSSSLFQANWWLSVLLAIPMAVVANLLTPYIQDWLASRSDAIAAGRVEDLMENLQKMGDFKADPQLLTSHLVSLVLKSALYLSFVMIINQVLGYVGSVLNTIHMRKLSQSKHPGYHKWMLLFHGVRLLHTATTIVGMLLILDVCTEGLSTYSNVERFDEYRAEVEAEVKRLKR